MPRKDDQSAVKIDGGMYRRLKTVAAWNGTSVAAYLASAIGPVLDRDLQEMGKEWAGVPESRKRKKDEGVESG